MVKMKCDFKIIHCENTKYVKFVFDTLCNDLNTFPDKTSWISLLRDLLGELELMQAWIQQNVGNVDLFLSLRKQCLSDTFTRNWNSRRNDSFRALFYRNFNNFGYQNYIDIVTTEKFRFALSRLRLSSHRLEVETGRWAKPNSIPFENRRCRTCNILEDEYHFLLECSRY